MRKSKGKEFVLKTTLAMSGDLIDWFPDECACLVITITPEYAQTLLKRLALFKKAAADDEDLYEMYYWDAAGQYHGVLEDKKEKKDQWTGRDIPTPDRNKPGRTEVDQIIIRAEELFWTASPKHSSVYISTDALKWNEIRQIAAEAKP